MLTNLLKENLSPKNSASKNCPKMRPISERNISKNVNFQKIDIHVKNINETIHESFRAILSFGEIYFWWLFPWKSLISPSVALSVALCRHYNLSHLAFFAKWIRLVTKSSLFESLEGSVKRKENKWWHFHSKKQATSCTKWNQTFSRE